MGGLPNHNVVGFIHQSMALDWHSRCTGLTLANRQALAWTLKRALDRLTAALPSQANGNFADAGSVIGRHHPENMATGCSIPHDVLRDVGEDARGTPAASQSSQPDLRADRVDHRNLRKSPTFAQEMSLIPLAWVKPWANAACATCRLSLLT